MNEKKYFTVSFPSIGYFFSTDPAFLKPANFATTSNGSLEDVYHLLSNKPLRQAPPRPKPKSEIETKSKPEPNKEDGQ